jgi:hypothetical protein
MTNNPIVAYCISTLGTGFRCVTVRIAERESKIDKIGNGDVIVDWDTMSDWDVSEEDD